MSTAVLKWEVWLSPDDEQGTVTVTVVRIDEDGQKAIAGVEVFEPFYTWSTIASWVWARLTLDSLPARAYNALT